MRFAFIDILITKTIAKWFLLLHWRRKGFITRSIYLFIYLVCVHLKHIYVKNQMPSSATPNSFQARQKITSSHFIAVYICQVLACSASSNLVFHFLCLFFFLFLWQSSYLVLFPMGPSLMTSRTWLFLSEAPTPACPLLEMSRLCLWMMLLTTSLHTQKSRRESKLRLIRLWAHPGSQWGPESKTLHSVRRPVCLRCNYRDCSGAMVHTGPQPWRKQTKMHTLVKQWTENPSVPIVLFCNDQLDRRDRLNMSLSWSQQSQSQPFFFTQKMIFLTAVSVYQ